MRSTPALCCAVAVTAALTTNATPDAVADVHETSPALTARPAPKLKLDLDLDRASYAPDSRASLKVTENVRGRRRLTVVDSSGLRWRKVADNRTTATFRAVTADVGATVSVTLRRLRDGSTVRAETSYDVDGSPSPSPSTGARWPGHQPGKVILGMSCGVICAQKESDLAQDYGVHRQFKNWGEWSAVARDIQEDHAQHRLPWVSIKSPGGARGWRAVANGAHDAEIRRLAAVLRENDDQPVILTFHHEPSTDGTEEQGADWAAAYVHWHDTLAAEGALANVADAPIVGDWLFNPRNKTQAPENWVTDAVLERAPFLGVDIYETATAATYATRIPFITDWMAARGFPGKQVGIGETGATDHYARSTAVRWLNESFAWAIAHPEQVGVISYFNSTANSRAGVYWPLDESAAKLAAYRGWLDQAVTRSP
jgi:hypothetical protein